jgi:hypothetical protein
MVRYVLTRFQLHSFAEMRREYVGACDEPQSETISLLPVLRSQPER